MHFYLLLRPFISILTLNAIITSTSSQSIPRVRSELQSPIVRPVGANVHIQCPVYDEGSGLLFYEWSREKEEPIEWYSSSRIKSNDKGILKIRSAVVSDSGVYHCKAINGFGSVTTSVVLKIVPSEDLRAQNPPLDNQYPLQYPREDSYLMLDSNSNVEFEYKPNEKVISKPVIIEKTIGSFIVLDCNPNVRGFWYKNGKRLHQKRRKSMTLPSLRPEDSGSYVCIVSNGLEQTNNTFILRVFDNPKPELKEFNPINSTVVLGDKAVFHCKVYSEVKPQIQWLKSFKDVRDKNEAIHMGLIDRDSFPGLHLTEKYYKVIKSGKVVDDGDGNYFNNLVINKTSLNDSANYVCLVATTSQGSIDIIHKSTYLTVVPLNKVSPEEQKPWNITDNSVAIPLFLLLIVAIIIIVFYCVRSKSQSKTKSQNENNNINGQKDIEVEHNREAITHPRSYYFPESVHSSSYNYGMEGMHWNTECSDYNSSSERSPYQT